jgi:hypothetical protein
MQGIGPSFRYAFGFAAVNNSLHIFGGIGDTDSGNYVPRKCASRYLRSLQFSARVIINL